MAYDATHRPGCARLGVMRLNAARLNVYEAWVSGSINGAPASTGPGTGLFIEGAAVQHVLNEQIDTGAFTTRGIAPPPAAGNSIMVREGDSTDPNHVLLDGRIIETTVRYEQRAEEVRRDIRCVDQTWLMERRLVLFTYVNTSATAIIQHLIATFTRGVSAAKVQAGLPVIDVISFSNEQVPACITEVCRRIGAHWFLDQNIVHAFTTEQEAAAPITQAAPRTSRDHQLTEDLSQVVTRIIGRGGGVALAIDLPAGEIEIPVEEGDLAQSWYAPTGGLVEINTQRVQYAGVRGIGATGSVIGTGNAPSSPPAPVPVAGTSHTVGATYGYAASFVTALGETLPGPVGSIRIQTFAPTAPPVVSARSRPAGSYPPGMIHPSGNGQIQFAAQIYYRGGAIGPLGAVSPIYQFVGNDFEVYLGPRTNYTAPDGSAAFYYPTLEPGGPAAPTSSVQIYRYDIGFGWNFASGDGFASGGGWYYQQACGYYDSPVAISTPSGYGSVSVAGLPISKAAGVTARKVYRTAANGAALKLLATVANNTATQYGPDTTTDAALGAAPPVLDSSGIKDEGQVLVGATSMVVSSTAPFSADLAGGVGGGGGWVRVAGMVVRYTSIGAGVLAGIPAAGLGAITATVRYGAQVLVQPRLVGVPPSGLGALTLAVRKGDTATIRLELLDTAARDAMAARLTAPGATVDPEDGVIELPLSDSRWGLVELAAQMAATMAERKDPHQTLRFASRDTTLQVGRLVTVTLTTPPISGTFRIQRITFSEIAIAGARTTVHPLRSIEATSRLFTFADLLRRLRGREGGVP